MKQLLKTQYGSHLYGTNTPTSDLDEKVVYLPDFDDVLLGRKLQTFKLRYDAEGKPVADNAVMPDNGVETEYVPFQTFCRDFLNGQTYALEVAFARYKDGDAWLKELVDKFTTCNVSSMAGFAMKQTFDYVHRGVRLEKARGLLALIDHLQHNRGSFHHVPLDKELRLDHTTDAGQKVLHFLASGAGLERGTTVNNGKMMETLLLNGRAYLETTTVAHLWGAVKKLVDSYGHRSQDAAEAEVDRKSLMHAVRVYEQALELLQSGRLEFPRPNPAALLEVKTTKALEEVKAHLLLLEASLETVMETAKVLPEKTPKLQADFDDWLLGTLRKLYDL